MDRIFEFCTGKLSGLEGDRVSGGKGSAVRKDGTGTEITGIHRDKNLVVAHVRVINRRQAFVEQDKQLDAVKGKVVFGFPNEVSVCILGCERVQDSCILHELREEQGDVSHQPQ